MGGQGHGSSSSARDTEVFVSGLYRLLLDNRKLLVALTGSASGASPDLPVHAAAFLREVFDRLEREVNLEIQAQGNETMDPAYAVRFAFALVYGVTVLDEALFPPGRPRPRSRVDRGPDGPASSCAGRSYGALTPPPP